MLEELKKESNYTKTENGATTYLSTNSYCLDLFSTIGAIRNANENDIVDRFIRAYAENRELAMKILFFARDVRGGLGERKVFRVIMKWLADNEPMSVRRNLDNIAEFGRYDDLLSLFGTQCEDKTIAYIKMLLDKDLKALKNGEEVSLLAKWLPSINASNWDTIAKAKLLADELNMSPAEYRKTLTKLRKEISIIENRLREKDYTFDYEKQPSKAMFKYRKAFIRNDKERYDNFLNKVTLGEAVLKTGALAPYEIIQPVIESYCGRLKKQDRKSIATTWEALEDFGSEEDAIVVVDGSGSMYSNSTPMPEAVAISLGIYFAERNKGAFKNHFITFSSSPKLVELKGKDIVDKVKYCMGFDDCANTNVSAVFNLILRTAVKNKIPQNELPKKIYIVSDMEFDEGTENSSLTIFEGAKKRFEKFGYSLPNVIFWNVQSRNIQQPVTQNEQGVALVSGCNPRLFSMIASGELSPLKVMLDILSSERYSKIVA